MTRPDIFVRTFLSRNAGFSLVRGLGCVLVPWRCRTEGSAAPWSSEFFLKGNDTPGAGVARRKPRRGGAVSPGKLGGGLEDA